MVRYLVSDPLPRWYGLTWNAACLAIHIWVHPAAARALAPIPPDSPLVRGLRKNFNLRPLMQGGFEDSRFGFAGAIQIWHEKNGALEFFAKLPHARYWQRTNAVAASVALLLMMLEDPIETDDPRPQFMTVHGIPSNGGCPIGGAFGGPLVRWLSEFPTGTHFSRAEEAMAKAYARMLGGERAVDTRSFPVEIYDRGGALSLDCPRGISTVFRVPDQPCDSTGYEISSNNVDTPPYYLALLAGLAALHDHADRMIAVRAIAASAS